jgi:hypothetical protein
MPERQELASRVYLNLDGTEVQREIMDNVLEVVVDQHAHLPDMFTVRLADPELKLVGRRSVRTGAHADGGSGARGG